MELTPIIVTNVLATSTSFGVTLTKPAEGVFIPSNVSKVCGLFVGQEVKAHLVPNNNFTDRTPWLAARVEVDPSVDPPPLEGELVSARVRRTMKGGGVWDADSMFDLLFPGVTKNDDIQSYNAVSYALRSMFATGECAKFQLWEKPDHLNPRKEWFTCYPQRADVDEWEACE